MNQVQLVQQLRQLCASGISSWARQGALMALMSRNLNGEIPTYVFLGFPKQIMFHGCFVRYLVFGKFMTKPFWDVS
jgi:hypothetical protein